MKLLTSQQLPISGIWGVKALCKSLRKTNTSIPIYILMPEECRNSELYYDIQKLQAEIIFCPYIEIAQNYTNNNKVGYWNETFFKLNIAHLIQFEKIVFLDADMIILKNIDLLFDYPSISATTGGKSAHPEWVEFNSGIMVLEPSEELYKSLVSCIVPAIERKQSMGLGFGDQDVFNQYYSEWINEKTHNFGEAYNVEHCFIDEYIRVNGKQSYKKIAVLHFIGSEKIWNKTMIQLMRMFHGLVHDKKTYELRACLKYLKYLYL